jgi:hypothetical protein
VLFCDDDVLMRVINSFAVRTVGCVTMGQWGLYSVVGMGWWKILLANIIKVLA